MHARMQATNNLRMVTAGLQGYQNVRRQLPPVPGMDPQDPAVPKLSWRVGILTFIAQDPLYKRFGLNAAWDAPVNNPLQNLRPTVYATGLHPVADNVSTRLTICTGPGTLFPDAKARSACPPACPTAWRTPSWSWKSPSSARAVDEAGRCGHDAAGPATAAGAAAGRRSVGRRRHVRWLGAHHQSHPRQRSRPAYADRPQGRPTAAGRLGRTVILFLGGPRDDERPLDRRLRLHRQLDRPQPARTRRPGLDLRSQGRPASAAADPDDGAGAPGAASSRAT